CCGSPEPSRCKGILAQNAVSGIVAAVDLSCGLLYIRKASFPRGIRVSLVAGTRLGVYEILSPIGAGGMGEVYRARDTKLKRAVAIKILPDELSRDTDRVRRFQREAEVLASLNHPNIAAIYDFQEENGSWLIVLELIEGKTLADRIARGPIP